MTKPMKHAATYSITVIIISATVFFFFTINSLKTTGHFSFYSTNIDSWPLVFDGKLTPGEVFVVG